MGTQGRIAIGARGRLAYGEQSEWEKAVIPTQMLDFNTESLKNELAYLVSEAQDPSRGTKNSKTNTSNINGDYVFEQSTQGRETLYKHALGDHVTMQKVDGGVRTKVASAFAGGAGAITVDDTTGFEDTPSTDWGLVAVYKDATGNIVTQNLAYSALTSTTFTLTGAPTAIPKGAWIMQRYIGASDFWDAIYTHYIEASAVLPAGLTFEVGRDVAYFVYEGLKVNTVENTFTAGELLGGTFGFMGRAEYVGGLLVADVTAGDTSFQLKDYTLTNSGHISAPVLSGVGLDDLSSSGTFTGTEPSTYIVEITAAGTPDTFRWSDDGGVTWTTGVAITGAAQLLSKGVSVTFAATTGHTLGDKWYVQTGDIIGFNFAGATIQMEAENDITYTSYNAYDGTFSGVPASGAGSISYDHLANLPVAPQSTWGTPAAAPDVEPLASFEAALFLNGKAQEVLGANFTLNNNLYADKYQLGTRIRAGLAEQKRTVEGSLNVEFDDTVMYHDYLAGTPAFLEIRCIEAARRLDSQGVGTAPADHWVYAQKHCILPKIKYSGSTPNITGPEQIVHDMPFTALIDSANNMNELAVIFVNTRASI